MKLSTILYDKKHDLKRVTKALLKMIPWDFQKRRTPKVDSDWSIILGQKSLLGEKWHTCAGNLAKPMKIMYTAFRNKQGFGDAT